MYRPADRTNPYARINMIRKASPTDRLSALDRPEGDGYARRRMSGILLGNGSDTAGADAGTADGTDFAVVTDPSRRDAEDVARSERKRGMMVVGLIIALLACLLSSAGHSSLLAVLIVSLMSAGMMFFVAMLVLGVIGDVKNSEYGKKSKGRGKRK